MDISEEELSGLYSWVDEIPLSRPKRNISRDFSDGVLMAEVLNYYCPKLVELHNYSSANSSAQKSYNWNTLNNKVFKKLGFSVSLEEQQAIVNCEPKAIERVLQLVHHKLHKHKQKQQQKGFDHEWQENTSIDNQCGQMDKDTGRKRLVNGAKNEREDENKQITALKETNAILEMKVRKLEQLVRLKDAKIETLMAKLEGAGMI
eukprot:TRINITY_DN7080_c0_g1_i1.p1 TRINITY_DN7080_c0_g1~~TRINITY_DN7080_c0_g1_i1.p1  ORF type:complete len:204 (+),score=30.83 TRINITY_DN7080_c0_g1_i1:25-636(+)